MKKTVEESTSLAVFSAELRGRRLLNQDHFVFIVTTFGPSNVIVTSDTDFTVKAVIDWELTYIAPMEFSQAAPWWLLFESPEAWESDLTKFLDRYRPRLELFSKEMRLCEEEKIQQNGGALPDSGRLSGQMARSMDNGVFWICLAARKSFLFDDIYWTFLDKMFFGPRKSGYENSGHEERLPWLTQEERDGIDDFVRQKLQQASESRLDEHMSMDEVMEL